MNQIKNFEDFNGKTVESSQEMQGAEVQFLIKFTDGDFAVFYHSENYQLILSEDSVCDYDSFLCGFITADEYAVIKENQQKKCQEDLKQRDLQQLARLKRKYQ